MDDAAWFALTLSLTVLGGIWTWVSFRRWGLRSGVRALAVTLLPLAAYFTDTLQMLTGVAAEVSDWAGSLVFDPTTWLGITLAGLAVVLFVVAGRLRPREIRAGEAGRSDRKTLGRRAAAAPQEPALGRDEDLDEIEALLRKRGIR